MRITIRHCLVIATCCLCGCFTSNNKDPYAGELIHKTDTRFNQVNLDSFDLENTSTSYVGSVHVYKNNLILVDKQFCWLFRYNVDGKLLSRNIGQGDSAWQLPCRRIASYIQLPNGGHMFMGPSWDVYVFDSNFNKTADYRVDWHPRGNKEYVAAHPDPSDPIMYSITAGLQPIKADDKNVYLPIFSQHKMFNPIYDSYGREARIFGRMGIKSGEVEEIYGRLSPVYQQNKEKRTFSYPFYDFVGDKNMAVMFPVDSVIYMFTKDFKPIKKIGSAGRDMDTNYQGTTIYEKMGNNWTKENRDKGYYTSINYVEERGILFRSYQKSGIAASDGLQIYKSDTLVADVDIPKKCKLVGYIKPYFYLSAGPNEALETTRLFRFKLEL